MPGTQPETGTTVNTGFTCPWCGEEYGSVWELFPTDPRVTDTTVQCYECAHTIRLHRDIHVTYQTRPDRET